MFILMDQSPDEDNVFYSQRGRGPIYRWHFQKELARWHVSRVDSSSSSPNQFCKAAWKSVPQNLKTQLTEHYIE